MGSSRSSQRTVSLVLLDDHQRRGGSRCGRDSSEGENAGERKLVGNESVNDVERDVYGDSSDKRLKHGDNGCFFARFFQLANAEFVAHRKCDKAECGI